MSRTKVAVRVSDRTLEHIGQAARRQRELLSPEELQERADVLSQEAVAAGPARPIIIGQSLKIYNFHLNNEWYGIPIEFVQEIAPLLRITPVPATPDYVSGVVNLRGEVVAVVDLKRLLELPTAGTQVASHILMVRFEEITMGFLVDDVADMMEIALNKLEAPLATISAANAALLRGVIQQNGNLLVLLDMERVVASEKIKRLLEPPARYGRN